jgi:hypothetical protein
MMMDQSEHLLSEIDLFIYLFIFFFLKILVEMIHYRLVHHHQQQQAIHQ